MDLEQRQRYNALSTTHLIPRLAGCGGSGMCNALSAWVLALEPQLRSERHLT